MSHRRRSPLGTNASFRRVLAALAALLPTTLAAAPGRFPYIPTTILAPTTTNGSADGGRAYVFREKDGSVEFSSLDLGGSVDGDGGFKTLTSRLPFLEEATDTTVFSPTLADNGELLVYVGDCDFESSHGIWTYTPSDTDDESGWEKHTTEFSDDAPNHPGPNFLGASLSFSSQLSPSASPPVLYTFGGMCANASSPSTWQSSGRYSNAMRKASPSSKSDYTVSSVASQGPVREAGFTLTGLQPALSDRGGRVTQRASYVMLGGHTQKAFINMSTAAVWNLPEETWSFVDIQNPGPGGSELRGAVAERAETTIDSRSGHTTVLNGDGDELVLFGGWVGDVSRAAEPQLVVLRMGNSYDEWEWVVPEKQPDRSGVYGHGAALLPGNVMMVYGGYEIDSPTRTKSKAKRASSGGPQFLDLESMKWSSSYTNPSHSSKDTSGNGREKQDQGEKDEEGEGSKDGGKAKRLGLGLGLGLGLPLLAAAIAFFLYRRRFTSRRRSMRDDAIAALAQDRAQFLQSGHDMAERDDGLDAFQPWPWYAGGGDPYANAVRSLGSETLRGGPLGTGFGQGMQIPRKAAAPRPARGGYQPAGSAVPPGIHPIYEADEEAEQDREERDCGAEALSGPPTPTRPHSDPFGSPLAGAPVLSPPCRSSATPSPEGQRVDPEVQDWMLDVDAAEGLLARRDRRQAQNGGISPTKTAPKSVSSGWEDDTRTGSNLSESARSAISSITRSTSGRSHFRAGLGLLHASAGDGRLDSSSSGSPSHNTAKTNFPALQAEGPTLLHGSESGPYDPPQQKDDEDEFIPMPGSPSKNKPRRGWLGSLRRVFAAQPTGYEPSDGSPTQDSFDHGPADFEARPHRLSSIGGGSLLRRKQGKRAWEVGLNSENNNNEEMIVEGRRRGSGETDWDIERAVEQRLVQVMFTVPREPLRVVNGEAEGDEASVKGRTSPAGSLERPWGGLTLPEVKPMSPFEDPFVERAPSRVSLRGELERVPSRFSAREELERAPSRVSARGGLERAPSHISVRGELERVPSRVSAREELERAPSRISVREELERAPSRMSVQGELERTPGPALVHRDVQDVEMGNNAVVAPLALPGRREKAKPGDFREREEHRGGDDGLSDGVSEEVSRGVSEKMSEKVSEKVSEEVSEEVGKAVDEAAHFTPSRQMTKVQEMVASIETKRRDGLPRRQS